MRIEIVGIGRMGSEIAFAMMLRSSGLNILLSEPHYENRERACAEFLDLLPVAKATNNHLAMSPDVSGHSNIYVITSGRARASSKEKKELLFAHNEPIVRSIINRIPLLRPAVFIVSNPPKQLAAIFRKEGWRAIPIRDETDELRMLAGNPKRINELVLNSKGYTQFTPAFACAEKILSFAGD